MDGGIADGLDCVHVNLFRHEDHGVEVSPADDDSREVDGRVFDHEVVLIAHNLDDLPDPANDLAK